MSIAFHVVRHPQQTVQVWRAQGRVRAFTHPCGNAKTQRQGFGHSRCDQVFVGNKRASGLPPAAALCQAGLQLPDASPQSIRRRRTWLPLRPSTTVALPVLPLPGFLNRSIAGRKNGFVAAKNQSHPSPEGGGAPEVMGGGLSACAAYFRSSAITRTMRSALAEVSGAPAR